MRKPSRFNQVSLLASIEEAYLALSQTPFEQLLSGLLPTCFHLRACAFLDFFGCYVADGYENDRKQGFGDRHF